MTQREDIAQQNIALRKDLAAAGPSSTTSTRSPATSSESGYYKEWKGKFGEDAWSLLEEPAASWPDHRRRRTGHEVAARDALR